MRSYKTSFILVFLLSVPVCVCVCVCGCGRGGGGWSCGCGVFVCGVCVSNECVRGTVNQSCARAVLT